MAPNACEEKSPWFYPEQFKLEDVILQQASIRTEPPSEIKSDDIVFQPTKMDVRSQQDLSADKKSNSREAVSPEKEMLSLMREDVGFATQKSHVPTFLGPEPHTTPEISKLPHGTNQEEEK